MYDVILAYITAFLLTYLAIPSVIHVSHKKRLMDDPDDDRRAHTESTPTLGGIAIFAGVIFSIILWTPFGVFGDLQYILCAFIVIFLIGAKDDIDPISPWTKMLGELFAAFILVFKANVKLTSLYGIFGIYDLPEVMAIAISIFVIIVIINAFNLIDGINGLSGSISALVCVTLGTWFLLIDRMELAIVAFALAGAAVAFLKYNITPARIFMGDTGALLCGLVASILAIKFVELHRELPQESRFYFKSAPAVIMGIMILPLFDTLRVFMMRSIRGRSPLSPDRNHIHHLLIDSGLTHMQATAILVLVNILFILLVVRYQDLGNLNLLILVLFVALVLTAILYLIATRQRKLKNRLNG